MFIRKIHYITNILYKIFNRDTFNFSIEHDYDKNNLRIHIRE